MRSLRDPGDGGSLAASGVRGSLLAFAVALAGAGALGACSDADAVADDEPGERALEDGAGDGGGAGDTAADAGAPAADGAALDAGAIDWRVNGHLLSATERAALLVVANDVLPTLAGTRAVPLTFAARGAWWALKEGTWGQPLADVYGYSNCNTASGDRTLGPLQTCAPGRAWQVGLAAVQVPGHTAAEMEALAAKIHPGTKTSALLANVAAKAGETKAVSDAIVASTGSLRASWLLRVPTLGFAEVVPGEVVPECIEGTKSWCFGSAWEETKKFAPTKQAALIAMADLERILTALAP